MLPDLIRPGLWRWTAPHPDWRPHAAVDSPGDWRRDVGCVLYRSPDAAVFIDPLVPPDAGDLWQFCDRHVQEAGRAVVLTTIRWHRRSRDLLVDRYGAATSRARRALPAGVEGLPIQRAGETMFWLPEHLALVPGDRILGAGGGLRICPQSWLSYLPGRLTVAQLGARLQALLELPVERVLVSHGDPVLHRGRAALARALADASPACA